MGTLKAPSSPRRGGPVTTKRCPDSIRVCRACMPSGSLEAISSATAGRGRLTSGSPSPLRSASSVTVQW